jgi:hypothetical protein
MELGFNASVSLTFRFLLCSWRVIRPQLTDDRDPDSQAVAMEEKSHQLKTFHATMAVTRLEEWCVEAETREEAQALLAAGQGHRCHLGDRLHFELEAIKDGS